MEAMLPHAVPPSVEGQDLGGGGGGRALVLRIKVR